MAPPPLPTDSGRDPYFPAILVLLGASLTGLLSAVVGGLWLANLVVLQTAVTFFLSSGALFGVIVARRAEPQKDDPAPDSPAPSPPAVAPAAVPSGSMASRLADRARNVSVGDEIRVATLALGAFATFYVQLLRDDDLVPLEPMIAVAGAGGCVIAAGLAATSVRYFVEMDQARYPEGPHLASGARLVAWIATVAAASVGLQWAGQETAVRSLSIAVALINMAYCFDLWEVQQRRVPPAGSFPLDLGMLSALGGRVNPAASLLDAAERQLGIDLRSTWALTVVRRGVEPLLIGLCCLGWLSTALTVVGTHEQALVERFGVPRSGGPLQPGLHLHWPWPIDAVLRLPVQRVQVLTVGHDGVQASGPENVLWARQHSGNEYTLLLGNGRDLITVDAAVQYRIADPRAWRYNSQNPADALRAIAYRAVMRNTVNRTLAEALSENLVTTTARMRAMVQEDADALGLGVEVLAFTVGGMHPPVAVSADYQAVVSAELGKMTAVVNAEAFRNQIVPAARGTVLVDTNTAIAQGAETLGQAAGEAWSFRTLQSQYGADPAGYVFRRRLETLERVLPSRRYTILDARIQRDGGELWLTP